MFAKIISAQKIVLGARPCNGWVGIAVDEKHIVTFTPPEILVLKDGHGDADIVALAGGFHPDVVVFAVQIFYILDSWIAVARPLIRPAMIGLGLAELRVEVEGVLREGVGVRAIVEIEVESVNHSLAFVGNRDAGVLLKGHGEETVQRALVSNGEKLGFPSVVIA